jgi:uncharacterized MAPEG superfamily protein
MTPELMYLVWSVALTLVLVVIAVAGATAEVGLPKLAGNRDGMPEMTGGQAALPARTATCWKAWSSSLGLYSPHTLPESTPG